MRTSPLCKSICVLICTTCSFIALSQTHRYVDPTGTDSGDCSSPGSPCATINYSVGQSATNDIVNLTEGTFSAATLSTRITLSGQGLNTIVQGLSVNAAVSGTDLVLIENLRVNSSSANGIDIGTSYVSLFNVNSSNHSGRNINIDASTSIQSIEISNCTLDGGSYGLWINEQTDLNGLTVLNTSMDGNIIGFYSQLGDVTSIGVRLSSVLVRNCTFNNNLRKGIYAEKLENAVFENITIDNSGRDATYDFNNGIDINLKWQSYSDITIRNSRVTNCGVIGINDIGTSPENRRTSAITIKARTDAGSYNGSPASLSNVTLDGVIIDGEVTDLRFGEMGKSDNDGIDMSTVTVLHCSIANDDLAGLINEENTNILSISNNYWGGSAPSGSDIENYGNLASTNQSGELANEIVDALNNSYATVADALAVGGTIQNIPSGTISGTSTISVATTLISPGAGNLHAGSLTSFEALTISGADLTLGSDFGISTTLDINASRHVVLDDYNLILSGVISGAGEITGSSSSGLYVSGTGALGTATFTSGFSVLERLDVNRTSSGTLVLGSNLDVEFLALTSGIVSTGANNLNFIGNTALEGNDAAYVNGTFVNVVTGSPSGNSLYFPIGVTEYRPIGIEGVDQTGTTSYSGTVTESTPPSASSFSGSATLDKLSETRYWTITPSAANVTGVDLIELAYGSTENVSDPANIRVAQLQTSDWFNLGGSGASPVSSSASPPNAIGLSLGDFALGDETTGTNFTELATVFVNASSGDDTNDGATSGTAKQTLTAGFGLVQSGGTINVAAGSYGEALAIDEPVTIAGTGSPTTTSITLAADVSVAGFEASTVNVSSGGLIQDGIDLAVAAGIVNVSSGTYGESITIDKALTLNGANAGISGAATRGTESIIDPGSDAVGITITSSDVTVDGFQLGTDNTNSNVTTGISSSSNTNIVLSNNIVFANGVGMSIVSASTGTISVSDNAIEMLGLVDPLNATPSFGIVVQSISGTADAGLSNNNIQAASYGIFGHALTATPTATIDGGLFLGCTKGIEINNTDGVGGFAPSSVDISNVTMSSFAGPGGGLSQPDTQAGIYAFVTGNAGVNDDLIISIDNVDISGVGSGGTDYSAIYIADFQESSPFNGTDDDGIGITATVTNSNIHDNENRGIYSRGRNAITTVNQSILSGNSFSPPSTGAAGVVRAFGTLNINNSEITNPSSGSVQCLLSQVDGTISATNSSFDINGNGTLATVSSGSIDMSGNWLGSVDETIIDGLVTSTVDFTPWIGSGTDTDVATAGFQPDLGTVYVGTGSQTSGGRLQEGHDLVDAAGTVVLAHADYAETVTVSKSVTFQPTSSGTDTSLDDLVMSASGETLTIDGNLLIDGSVTLNDGIIDVVSGELRLGSSASDLVESPASMVMGNVTMDPRSVGTGSIAVFGVSIAAGASDDLGNVTIARNSGTNAIITDGPYSSISLSWDITVDTEPTVAGRDVTFTWLSDFDNGKDMTMISVFRDEGAGWTQVHGPIDVSATNPRTLTVTGVTQFSEWTMAQNDQPLPVELLSFDAFLEGNQVSLAWTTLTEINSSYFEIQKSLDGKSFLKAGHIDAAGNSSAPITYQWKDQPLGGSQLLFYRLLIMDVDGSYEFSNTVIARPRLEPTWKVYPNPTTQVLKVDYYESDFSYEVLDQSGKSVQKGVSKGYEINVSSLIPGVYFVRVEQHKPARFIME